ncbi:MAG TPA: endolytic transglycosylase MltG [Streptosporangiaceae bacterium]|nr:endolytic transglycosylase MltG [Streptosporangiaceae bacterium]
MSENGTSWSPNQDPRLFQPPQGLQPSPGLRPPSRGLQPPQPSHATPPSHAMQPPQPLHHDPRDHDPRLADPRRAQDSPWRRTQRHSGPEATGWHSAAGSHDAGPGGGEFYSPNDPESYDDDRHIPGGRFVPGFGGEDDEDEGEEPERPVRRRSARRSRGRDGGPLRRRRLRWIAPLVALVVILIPLGIGGAYVYHLYQDKYHPADYSGAGTGRVVVQVTQNETATGLGPQLVKLGVVASSRAFVLAAEHSSNPNGLLPGFYGMHLHMKASLAYALLLNPKNLVQVTVTIPEGWRLSQILAYLGAKSGISASAYQAILKNPAQLHLPAYANGKPEGYLFPATYEVVPHESALGVLSGMVQRFDQEATQLNLATEAKRVHLSEAQVIIMASLVEAEGGRLSDYPKIAQVIYNRLAQHIPLELDSTVLYGLNKFGIVASNAQLTSTSPYNTYNHKGLPPGPIDSPGAAAIQAVLNPAAGNWLYFVTVNPQTKLTLFTASQAQFEQYRAELQHYLAQHPGA